MFCSLDIRKKKKTRQTVQPQKCFEDLTILLIDLTFQIIQGLLKLGLFSK